MPFIYYNPNPERKTVGDCTVRAISKILNVPWEDAYLGICVAGLFSHDVPSSNAVWGSYLKSLGFKMTLLPNICPVCYTVKDFARDNPNGTYLVNTDRHVIAVVDGDYYDTWDSGDEIVNFYWTKEA